MLEDTIEKRGDRWVLFRGPIPVASSRSISLLREKFPQAVVKEPE